MVFAGREWDRCNLYHEWVLALKYVVNDGELEGGSSAPGGIIPGTDVTGAHFYSYLVQNASFFRLDQVLREVFKKAPPINRTSTNEPEGNWHQDRAYGQGGRFVNRFICEN